MAPPYLPSFALFLFPILLSHSIVPIDFLHPPLLTHSVLGITTVYRQRRPRASAPCQHLVSQVLVRVLKTAEKGECGLVVTQGGAVKPGGLSRWCP